MIRLLAFAACLVLCQVAAAADLYSRTDGSWSTVGTWSYTPGGASCGCTPIASDNVTINHTVNMDKHLTNVGSSLNGITGILTINVTGSLLGGNTYDLDIRSTGRLYLCGTLTARDMTFSNGSIVNVCSTGNLVVNRDFFNKNNSNSVTINGTMTVNGEYENGNGGIISGTGTINITNGPVTNTGSTYGCEGFDPCNNSYPCSIVSPCATPLPVSYLSLAAQWTDEHAVKVTWTTASEINNHYFDVLRSTDGLNFEAVGRVTGNGTTSQMHTYSLLDNETPPVKIIYYRIRQVDFDGSSTYSQIVSVARKAGRFQVHVYPNPFPAESGSINILVENAEGSLQFELLDATGRVVYRKAETAPGSVGLILLPVSRLASGVYLLRATLEDQVMTTRLVTLN